MMNRGERLSAERERERMKKIKLREIRGVRNLRGAAADADDDRRHRLVEEGA